jgi:citrate synthase
MFQPGLKNVTAVQTELSYIDGNKGLLRYRGIDVQELVKAYSFEEVAYFLLYGEFPDEISKASFVSKLRDYRYLPDYMERILLELPATMEIMDALRTVVSSLYIDREEDIVETSLRLVGIIPTIISYHYRRINHLEIVKPNKSLTHVENFIYMLSGIPNSTHAKILETYLILTMEHGLNASTFAARVTISTESDIVSAITSAIGTMKGPLHGGAPSGVIELLEEIGAKDTICEVIHNKLRKKERIMGFGHRVYKTTDPRAEALKNKIMKLTDLPDWVELAFETEQKTIDILKNVKPDQKLFTNVEYYAAAIMKALDINPILFTAIFSSSRVVGWCAHAMEQLNNNTIFRPNAMYIGK